MAVGQRVQRGEESEVKGRVGLVRLSQNCVVVDKTGQ